MKKVIRLTENDLMKIVKRVISEQSEPNDKDFKLACTVAAEVENWWKGQTRDSFFESFQGAINDEDDEAAESYNKKLDTYRTMLRSRLTGGSSNLYYKQINQWFIKIVDEIETEIDPQYGMVYNDESRDRVFDMYWQLIPYLEKIYHSKIQGGFNDIQ